MIRTLYVLIGVDCDPDRPSFGGTGLAQKSQAMIWKGVTEGIFRVLEAREKAGSLSPKITWNIRSDDQIEQVYGHAGWAAAEFLKLWERLKTEGDEIAWHPHLWRWNRDAHAWYQEVQDLPWMEECLEKGINGFREIFGAKPMSVHSGWCFHNNTTMQRISTLGVRVDYSALPGMQSIGVPRKSGALSDNEYDWRQTPPTPYSPSREDYRVPASSLGSALPLLEIPEYTFPSLPVWALGLWANVKKSTWGGRRRLLSQLCYQRSFVQINTHPRLFAMALDRGFWEEGTSPFFASHFHPDEFLSQNGRRYGVNFLFQNLRMLATRAEQKGGTLRFVTASEAADLLSARAAQDTHA